MLLERPGLLIDVEGIDGAGKTTLIETLMQTCKQQHVKAARTAFPRLSSTFTGPLIKNLLGGGMGKIEDVSPHYIATLFANDRYESAPHLRHLLSFNEVVFVDRYVPSTWVYQGIDMDAREFDEFVHWDVELEYTHNGMPIPDACLWLDTDPQVAAQRIAKRNELSVFESSGMGFLRKAAGVYGHINRKFGRIGGWYRIDGASDVAVDAWNIVRDLCIVR